MKITTSLTQWARVALCGAACFTQAAVAGQLDSGTFKPVIDETKATTLFAFDNVSIPFTRSLNLEMNQPEKYSGNPVVARGAIGEPDSWAVQFYGSVLKIDGKFRMWYAAQSSERGDSPDHNSSYWRPAYAESMDGVHWTKPKLGLVEYRSTKENNLVSVDPLMGPINVKVLYEPEDPDPARRYKMTAHVYYNKTYPDGKVSRHGTLAPYVSADGFNWKLVREANPVDAEMQKADMFLPYVHNEPAGGLYKWDGMYYSSGQNPYDGLQPAQRRTVRTYRSRDFMEWSQTSTVSFIRSGQHELRPNGNDGKQTHEGVSVWNRGNVLLGLSGMWQGATEWPNITIDLGFVVSNDAIYFREPMHEWKIIGIGEDGAWDQGGLIQGQGFENVGDKTYIYYGAWDPRTWTGYQVPIPPRGGVGLATLPRDRFGALRVNDYGEGASEFITTALEVPGNESRRLYLNADGLGKDAALKFEILTKDERPVPGFSGANAAIVKLSGFQTPILWNGQGELVGLPTEYRIKATFVGEQKEGIKFNAIYVMKTGGK